LRPGKVAVLEVGEGWEQMRDAVSSGWSLARFAEVAAQR
jgi:hypothetical protein